MIYVAAFALSIFLYLVTALVQSKAYFVAGKPERRPVLPFVMAAIPLVLVSGLRYGVGTDYFNTYYTGFYRLLNNNFFDQFEVGYLALNKLIQVFTSNVFVLFFVTSLIVVGFTFAAFRKMSSSPVFSILLFLITRYYFISMNGVRQLMACAVFAYALWYAIDRDLKWYLIFSALAISFHYSALILLPTYWLMEIHMEPKATAILLAIFGIGGGLGYQILIRLLPATSKWGYTLNTNTVAGLLFTIGTILLNIFILIVYYLPYREHEDESMYRCFLTLQVLATGVSLLLPWIPAVERAYWCFSYPIIVSFPVMASYIKPRALGAAASLVLIAVFSGYAIYDIGVLNDHEVLPYDHIGRHEAVPATDWTYREFVTDWDFSNDE